MSLSFKSPEHIRQKSAQVLYKYREVNVTNDILDAIVSRPFHDEEEDEAISEMVQDLAEYVAKQVTTILTERQCQILTALMSGKTQAQVADQLGIDQSSVHKAIHGSIVYSKNFKYPDPANKRKRITVTVNLPETYVNGGSKRKLKLALVKDPIVQDYMEKLGTLSIIKKEIKEEEARNLRINQNARIAADAKYQTILEKYVKKEK